MDNTISKEFLVYLASFTSLWVLDYQLNNKIDLIDYIGFSDAFNIILEVE